MPKYLRTNKKTGSSPALQKMRRNIYWQAGLALVTVVLTIVIVFTMTSAWYTNIVQTSGLVFQAESWGFDGTVQVLADSIVAAPGDEGIIGLEVENTNESMAAVSVSVSKTRMFEDDTYTKQQMQKRLYFYVDTQMTRNDETMERVYLNSMESYTYTLFSQGKLVLTEELHNDALLKWQWVYDVLGYYVLGTYSDTTDVAILEYLRPIEYDYDEATTTFDPESLTMSLATVDGTMTVEEFLVELSKTDGYAGVIDPEDQTGMGFYPVDVDENGYGVYAYLCNFSEIEQETAYDTKLAAEAASATEENPAKSYLVQLNIAAQKNDENVLNVATLDGLRTAIELNTGSTIQLTGDITIPADEKLTIPAGTKLMLDLNTHTITIQSTDSAYKAIEAQPGSSLTVVNGSITGSGKGRAVYAVGAEVVCNAVSLSGFEYGVYVGDKDKVTQGTGSAAEEVDNTLDSRIRLVDCTLSATTCTVFVSGNGDASAQKTQVLIDGCTLSSASYVLSGNGTYWGTDIQIMDSKLVSDPAGVSTAIYHPQKSSTLTIYNSEVSGYTGIAVKGGTVRVYGSAISGLGKVAENFEPAFSGSGFSDTGDGIYIETNYGWSIDVEIGSATVDGANGGAVTRESVITSQYGLPVQVYEPNAKHVTVTIVSGLFSDAVPDAYIAAGSGQSFGENGYTVSVKNDSQ